MFFKAIIFDLDGTIADTVPVTVFTFKEAIKILTGKDFCEEDIIKMYGPTDLKVIEGLVDHDKRDISSEIFIQCFKNNICKYLKPIDGIDELLTFIREKEIKIGLFTGRSSLTTNIVLENLKILDKFDEILSGDNIKHKPNPQGILEIMKRMNVRCEESIYVGDLDVDITASKAAGVMSVLALWSSIASKCFIEINPDKYFTNPFQFINWLKEY